jgi:hypothetical protein
MIDYCHDSHRLSFMRDFDYIEMMPIPHRNTINFIGMLPR